MVYRGSIIGTVFRQRKISFVLSRVQHRIHGLDWNGLDWIDAFISTQLGRSSFDG